jgi:hypothetical protein
MEPIKKDSWKYKLLIFVAMKIVKVPMHINFTRAEEDHTEGIGFAWTSETATKMVGKYTTLPPKPTRAMRRALKRAAQDTAKDLYHGDSEK